MFGAPASTGFGGFGGFGAASQSSFGAAAPSSGFAFGAPAAQSQPAFGGFGAAASTPAFGQPQQQQQTSLFGAAAPSTGFGGFGATANQPSAFGGQTAQQQPGAFGGGGGFGGFGAAPAAQSTLGGTNAFGSLPAQPAFGAATGSTFGGFGAAPAAQSTGFGAAPAAQSTGFGGFGQQPQQTSLFGAASTPAFGQPQSQSSLFGATPSQSTSTGLFGAAAPSPFGAPAAQQNSLFGGATATPAFGQTPTTNAFGGGLFGNNASSSSMNAFGAAPATTSTFGGFGGGGFGQQQQQQQQQPGQTGIQGSRVKRFEPTTERTTLAGDKTNIVVYQTITAMPEYLNKSLEEIRWEDMQLAGDQPLTSNVPFSNVATQPASTGFGGFGTTAAPSTGGLFGQTQQQPGLFGASQPQTTSFGVSSSQPSLFSTPSTGFGQQSQPAFSFGQTGASTSTFGAGGAFGTAQSGGAFGGGGLFGQTQSTFGQTQAQPSTGGFGTFGTTAPTTQSTSSLFGGSATGSLFGGGTGSSLFGNTGAATGGGLFGSNTGAASSSFAFPSSTGGLFGQSTAPSTGGLFGQTQSQGGLFGSTNAPATSTGGLFGGGSLFGPASQQPAQSGMFGSFNQQPQQQQQQFAQQSTQVAKVDENPFLTNFLTSGSAHLARNSANFPAPANPPANHVGGSPSSVLTIAPRLSIGRSAARQSGIRRNNAYAGSPASNIIPSMTMTPTRPSSSTSLITMSTPNNAMNTPNSSLQNQSIIPHSITADLLVSRRNARKLTDIAVPTVIEIPLTASKNNRMMEESKEQINNEDEKREPQFIKRNDYVHSEAPVLNNPDYFTSPSMSELAQMSPRELSTVKNFSVHHAKYGSVEWLEPVDVRNLHLDRLVQFSSSGGASSVEVDPTLDSERGATLNRPAIVTLEECWPQSSSNDPNKAASRLKRYEAKLKEASERAGAQFISYDPVPGEWKFKVEQFA